MSINTDQNYVSDMGLLSQLSYMPYGNSPLVKGESFNSFIDDGINYILNFSYTVIDYTDTPSGMQAIILAKNDSSGNPTNEYVIAFRGTEPKSLADLLTDGLVGIVNDNIQSEALTFVQSMMSTYSITAEQLTLAGHSLGGILTQAVGAELHIQGYAFNPYGANLLNSLPALPITYYPALGKVLEILGLGEQNDPWVKDNLLTVSYQDNGLINGDVLSNLATEFSEFVAGNDHLGGVLPIFGDNVGLMGGHSMATLNAAIQHYNEILAHFTETTTMNDLSLAYILSGEKGSTLNLRTLQKSL